MGRLIVIVLVAAGAWAAYWAVGATALERGLNTWIDERRQEGWVTDVAELEVRGFPNRFDTELRDLRFADPDTGIAWSAPFFQILALSYRPTQVIAVWPNEQKFSTPFQTLDITTTQARGSIFLEATPSLALDRSSIVIDDLTLQSSLGWTASLNQGRFATEQVAARENAHRFGVEVTGLDPAQETLDVLDPAGIMPPTIDRLHLDADMTFDGPLDRHTLEDARPQITAIDLSDLSAIWGDVTFRAAGELTVAPDGTPEGSISIRAVEWRRILQMSVAGGLIPQRVAPSVERGLEFVAGLSGRSDTLDFDVTFKNGITLIGPLPVGPAPKIIIR